MIERQVPGADAVPREVCFRVGTVTPPHLRAERGILAELMNGRGEREGIPRRNQEAVAAVLDELRNASDVAANNRKTGRQRFGVDVAERLLDRGEREEIGFAIAACRPSRGRASR